MPTVRSTDLAADLGVDSGDLDVLLEQLDEHARVLDEHARVLSDNLAGFRRDVLDPARGAHRAGQPVLAGR
jgi:hypothetical protein